MTITETMGTAKAAESIQKILDDIFSVDSDLRCRGMTTGDLRISLTVLFGNSLHSYWQFIRMWSDTIENPKWWLEAQGSAPSSNDTEAAKQLEVFTLLSKTASELS